MRVLVLGAYGLIGAHVTRRLLASGHEVMGLGRNVTAAARRMPRVTWLTADLARLTSEAAWLPILRQSRPDAIVNAAGVLQDGLGDDVAAVQSASMRALYRAAHTCEVTRFVQISAPGARPDAATAFMRSKGEADAALAESALVWTVLRPGLVIGPDAYGGTALLRGLAGLPVVAPVAYPDARVQTVAVEDVAGAVLAVLDERVPSRRVYDLVEATPQRLDEVVDAFRAWLGLRRAIKVRVPDVAARAVSRVADGLGWLGWRSPLRSTAMAEIRAGVTGDPAPWRAAGGPPPGSLQETLAGLPSTLQERWFARLFLAKPLVIGTLAAFWLVTGIITLLDPELAASTLTARGTPDAAAQVSAIGGAIADIGLGLAILWRRTMPLAARGMVLLTLAYLAGGTWLAPDLWADPLGPLVKAIPALVLALVALALAEDR